MLVIPKNITKCHVKYCLSLITELDLDIIEISANIQLSKVLGFLKLQNKLRD